MSVGEDEGRGGTRRLGTTHMVLKGAVRPLRDRLLVPHGAGLQKPWKLREHQIATKEMKKMIAQLWLQKIQLGLFSIHCHSLQPVLPRHPGDGDIEIPVWTGRRWMRVVAHTCISSTLQSKAIKLRVQG